LGVELLRPGDRRRDAADPQSDFDLLGIANTSEVWIRVVGVIAIVLGIVCFEGGRSGAMGVVRSSVPARVAAVIGFVVLWIAGGPWQLLIFAAGDLAGLVWTWSALRSPSPATV
jgi:hypothetical protein